jgi:putative transposase
MAKLHHRNIRLPKYDYSREGSYYVTICTQDRKCLFGDIRNGEMRSNEYVKIVKRCWDELVDHYSGILLDMFVVMPNHVHGIIVITGDVTVNHPVGEGLKPPPTNTDGDNTKYHGLTEIVRAFKTFSARKINEKRGPQGQKVWQRNYYEHIIRNERSLARIREYIYDNPRYWLTDDENPERKKP